MILLHVPTWAEFLIRKVNSQGPKTSWLRSTFKSLFKKLFRQVFGAPHPPAIHCFCPCCGFTGLVLSVFYLVKLYVILFWLFISTSMTLPHVILQTFLQRALCNTGKEVISVPQPTQEPHLSLFYIQPIQITHRAMLVFCCWRFLAEGPLSYRGFNGCH